VNDDEKDVAYQLPFIHLLKGAATIPMLAVYYIYTGNRNVKGVNNTNVGTIHVTTGWGAHMWIDE
jgi:hypothetical protein